MAITFAPVDPEKARASLAKKQRSSKHRELLQAFWDAEIPAAELELDIDPATGEPPKKTSVTSGLNQALKTAKENKVEWAEHIQVRNRADGVFLVNTRLMAELDAEAEDEAENAEAAVA